MPLARCAPMHDEENRRSRRGFILGVAGATTATALGCRSQTHGVEQGTPSTASPPPGKANVTANEKTSAASASASAAAEAPAATGTVPKRKLGRTGEMVSMIGLGGAHIGAKSLSDDEA